MGSIRRRLTAAATAASTLPGSAAAEVCDKVRPDWMPAAGPQGWLAETAYILASPPAILVLLLLALALLVRRRWLAVLGALLALALAALLAVSRQADIARQAMAEGCIATAAPAITVLTLASLATLLSTFSHRRR